MVKDKKVLRRVVGIAVGLSVIIIMGAWMRHRITLSEKSNRDLEAAIVARGRIMKVVSIVYGKVNIDDTDITVLVCDAKPGNDGTIVQVRAYLPAPGLPVEIHTSEPLKDAHCSNP